MLLLKTGVNDKSIVKICKKIFVFNVTVTELKTS